MHTQTTRHLAKSFCAVVFTAVIASTSSAAVVWDLNQRSKRPVGVEHPDFYLRRILDHRSWVRQQ